MRGACAEGRWDYLGCFKPSLLEPGLKTQKELKKVGTVEKKEALKNIGALLKTRPRYLGRDGIGKNCGGDPKRLRAISEGSPGLELSKTDSGKKNNPLD